MKQPVLVIDLDETLIATHRLKRDLFVLAGSLGSRNYAKLYARKFRRRTFNLKRFSKILFKDPKKQSVFEQQANWLLSRPKVYNYLGVEIFLKRLQKSHALILLTYGHRGFQKQKLRQSGLKRYFKKIIITQEESKLVQSRRLKRLLGKYTMLDNARVTGKTMKLLGLPFVKIKSGNKSPIYFKRLQKKL